MRSRKGCPANNLLKSSTNSAADPDMKKFFMSTLQNLQPADTTRPLSFLHTDLQSLRTCSCVSSSAVSTLPKNLASAPRDQHRHECRFLNSKISLWVLHVRFNIATSVPTPNEEHNFVHKLGESKCLAHLPHNFQYDL